MTIRLYEQDPYMKEFTAEIVSIRDGEDGPQVELDRTAFFPEGGGQPCDLGYIGNLKVTYVYETPDKVFHVVEKAPQTMGTVHCRIDWHRRFDHMQQHLGQHILSAVLQDAYDAATVGFYLSEQYTTVDVDRPLTDVQIKEAEQAANRAIFENRKVRIIYPTAAELDGMKLRKLPPVTENIRIVAVDALDYSPCCGTHPANTGEVGLLKVTKTEKYKAGVRIELVCGRRALADYTWKSEALSAMASGLSVGDRDVPEHFRRIMGELQDLKKQVRQLGEQMLDYKAAGLMHTAETVSRSRIIVRVFENEKMEELRALAQKLTENSGTAALFGLKGTESVQFIFQRSRDLSMLDMRILCKQTLPLLEGKGGGSEASVQGGGKNCDRLEEALENAALWLKAQLKNS